MAGNWIEVNESSDTWDLKEPIQGIYKSKKENVGPNNSNQYIVETKDGNVGVWGSTVLDNKFAEVPVGSEVKIEYLGKKDGKRGQYKDFSLAYRPTGESKAADIFGADEVI